MKETVFQDMGSSMEKAIGAYQKELSRLRTGRASPALLEGIRVDYYGTPTPINFSPTKYALCRCGHSKNRPYCDYSHAEKRWSDEEESC